MTRPRHGTIVAYAALFVALGGTSYAAVNLEKGAIGSREVANHSIKARDLSKGAKQASMPSTRRLTAVVEDVMTTDQVLTALATAVEGDAGPQGPKGDPAPGPAGPTGEQGEQGPRGAAIGSAYVTPLKTEKTGDITVHPSGTGYCVGSSAPVTAPYVSLDSGDDQYDLTDRILVSTVDPHDANDVCAGYQFRVVAVNSADAPVLRAFYVTLN